MSIKSNKSFHIFALLSVCFLLFFFRMGARDLWSPDEPRYAQVAREMLETGDWVVPHLNGDVYKEKPPLYFWLVVMLSKPFGDVTETTARLPSAVAATLVVLLTYLLGAKMLGDREAFLGAAIVATNAQFCWMGRVGALDTLLALCILSVLAAFYFGYSKKRPFLYLVGFAFLIPAVLTKGPVGIAIPLVVMLAFLLTEAALHEEGARRQLAWFGVATVIGLILVALAVVSWWQAAYHRSGGIYGSLSELSQQTGGRMFKSYSHQQPFYYFFGEILWQFLPWTVFFPLTVFMLKRKGEFRAHREMRFLIIWFLSVFFLFTLISGKRSQYILLLFPAAGLLIGWALTVSDPDKGQLRERREFSIPLLLIVLSLGGFILALIGIICLDSSLRVSGVLPACVAAFIVLAILVQQCYKRPPRVALNCAVAAMAISVALLFGFFKQIMHIKGYASARPFCESVLAAMDEDEPLYFYDSYRPNIHYYMHRRMPEFRRSNEKVVEALGRSRRVFLVLRARHMKYLEAGDALDDYLIEEITGARVGSRDMICVLVHRSEAVD